MSVPENSQHAHFHSFGMSLRYADEFGDLCEVLSPFERNVCQMTVNCIVPMNEYGIVIIRL